MIMSLQSRCDGSLIFSVASLYLSYSQIPGVKPKGAKKNVQFVTEKSFLFLHPQIVILQFIVRDNSVVILYMTHIKKLWNLKPLVLGFNSDITAPKPSNLKINQ